MGYADLGIQGAIGFKTPALDRLAQEGTRFTDFYVAQAVCTASRAALMTGCYPNRLDMHGAYNHTSRDGIADEEWLLPEMFRDRGYATAEWASGISGHVSNFTLVVMVLMSGLVFPIPTTTPSTIRPSRPKCRLCHCTMVKRLWSKIPTNRYLQKDSPNVQSTS